MHFSNRVYGNIESLPMRLCERRFLILTLNELLHHYTTGNTHAYFFDTGSRERALSFSHALHSLKPLSAVCIGKRDTYRGALFIVRLTINAVGQRD